MYSRRFLFTVLACCLLARTSALCAFEISAYYDPVSIVTQDYYRGGSQLRCYNGSVEDFRLRLSSLANNDEVLQWYDSMGITNLCVHYRPSDFQTFLGASGESLGVMNERWPNRMYQFLEAQGKSNCC